MPDNNIEWGQGGVNNSNDWGKAKANSTNNFGAVYDSSPSGDTNIAGGQPVVSITYSASAFCADASDPTPTVQNNAGAGTFSSTTGLVFISTSTGEVDISASTAGSYVITYTDTDAATATFNLSINALPTVIVNTSAGTICNGESTILTASGASTYVWNDGNTDNPRTVSPTTTTLFTATGTDSNGCVSSGGTTITVNALPTVEITGTLTYCAGSTTTLTATAGLSSYLWSTGATTQAINVTSGSYTVTGTDSNGCSATSAASAVTELPLDVATVVYDSSAYCQVPTGATAVDGYYPLYSTESASNAVSSDGTSHSHVLGGVTYYMPNAGIVVYHGTYSLTTTPTITGQSGTFNSPSGLSIDANGVINKNASTAGTYSVIYTTNGSCPITVTNSITITALDNATFNFSSSAYCNNVSDPTPSKSASGTFSSSTGLNINTSTGEVDLDASTAGTYVIGFVTSGSCPNSSIQTLTINAAPTVAISGTLSYCAGSNTTLTATAGLSSYLWSSGETTQSITATAGSYTVTGTDSNGCSTTSSSVTVTETALDNAAFSYSASSYAPTDADPTPTITGLTGGTFSGTTGLVINSTTGEIDLSASTVASHTITYDTTSSGSSVCPNTSTQTVEIAVAGIANNYSMSFDGNNDYIDFGDNINISGDATFSFWLYRESTSPSNEGGIITIAPSGATSDYISISLWSDKIQAVVSNGGTTNRTSTQTISKSSWHHIVVIKSSTAITSMYINGSSETLATGGGFHGTLTNLPQATLMKAEFNGTNYYASGKLDEVAIWDTALTSTQVSEIYNATSTNLTKDLTTVSGSNLKYWNRMGD
jgi:hypothetical protein